MSSQSLGDLIRARRHELGMSQARLADLVGVSSSTLSAWERGQSEPASEESKMALEAVLGIGDSWAATSEANPDHLDRPAAVAAASNQEPRRRGRRLRLEDDESPPNPNSDGGHGLEVDDSDHPSFAEWLNRFGDDPDVESREADQLEDAPGQGRAVADAMSTVKDSELVNTIRDADPITAIKESEIVNTIKQADPIGALRESEGVSTVKDRITDFLRPKDEPDHTATRDDPVDASGPESVQTTHSLTEDTYHEPSYVEDPDEMDHYRNRWIITAFVVIVLLMVAFWSLGQAQAALADGWERMFNMLNF